MQDIKADISSPMKCEDFLRKHVGLSARFLRRLKLPPNAILRGDELVRTIDTVYPGDVLTLITTDKSDIIPNDRLKCEILEENNDFIVFNKPPFMPVHPSHKHPDDTLGNYYCALFPGSTFRPINRLDRDTSGACVVARSQKSAADLQKKVQKEYIAVVMGSVPESGTINDPIKREKDTIIKRCVAPDGETAVTHFEKTDGNENFSLLKINLETGRTHQIRVHFSSRGHPLFGDDLYGANHDLISRQALHCSKVIIGKDVYTAPLPKDMEELIEKLKK